MKVSSVLVGREVYPLFQAGKSLSSKVFILEIKVYPLFQAGKSLSSKVFILEMKVYPLFQTGKSLSSKVFYFRDESILCSCRQGSLSSVSDREEFIL